MGKKNLFCKINLAVNLALNLSLGLTFSALPLSAANASVESNSQITKTRTCESAKEFITTFEYLRNHLDLSGSADNAVKIASKVAEGCTGAAKRFIQTSQFLQKVELPLQEVISTATEFARKEDANVEAFNHIFTKAYAEDGFDLDLASSLKMAKAISVEYSGDVERALQDFKNISDYCMKKEDLPLSRPDCAELAKKVSLAEKEKGPLASDSFVNSYKYLKSTAGLAPYEAQKLALDLVRVDPSAFENFKLSYEYALADKGLKSSKAQALQFAKKIAQLSVKESNSKN